VSPVRAELVARLQAAIKEGDMVARNHLDVADLRYDEALESAVVALQQREKLRPVEPPVMKRRLKKR